jgi:hypothetical protein
MTFWQFIFDNKVKILGSLATLVAGLLSMIALGMFNGSPTEPALLESVTIRWMTIILSLLNLLLGGGTVAAGLSNTTKIRVAEAEATVAVAKASTAAVIESALNTPVPGGKQA